MIEPSNADLQSCPETVQNYVKHLEAEASEKYCICPIMSRNMEFQELTKTGDISGYTNIKMVHEKCLGKDCALWVIERPNGDNLVERCGLIK